MKQWCGLNYPSSTVQVAINGQHYCEYTHRVPFSEVETLQIQGDLRLKLVEFKRSDHYPMQPASNLLNVINPVIQTLIHLSLWEY